MKCFSAEPKSLPPAVFISINARPRSPTGLYLCIKHRTVRRTMKWPQPILRHHVTTLRTDRHDSSQQTATVTPTTCSKGRQLQPGMKEAGSRWQSNPLAAYILCCTPPRDVQAPYEQRGGFPFIYSTKIDITIQVHPLETPTCNPFQHPCSKRGNRNKVVIQPWPLQCL